MQYDVKTTLTILSTILTVPLVLSIIVYFMSHVVVVKKQ